MTYEELIDKVFKEELKLMYIYGFKFDNIVPDMQNHKVILYCKVPIASDFKIDGEEMAGEFMAKTIKELILKHARLNGISDFNISVKYETFNMKWQQNHYDFAKRMMDIGSAMDKY